MIEQIGEFIKNWRHQSGLTQQELAQLAEVSLPTIQNLERNIGNPTLDILTRICENLGFEFLPKEKEVNWSRLIYHGLTLTKKENSLNEMRSLMYLKQDLIQAARKFKTLNEREKEALESLVLALGLHYPLKYQQYLKKSLAHNLWPSKVSGRHIKLSRISKGILAEYL